MNKEIPEAVKEWIKNTSENYQIFTNNSYMAIHNASFKCGAEAMYHHLQSTQTQDEDYSLDKEEIYFAEGRENPLVNCMHQCLNILENELYPDRYKLCIPMMTEAIMNYQGSRKSTPSTSMEKEAIGFHIWAIQNSVYQSVNGFFAYRGELKTGEELYFLYQQSKQAK